MFYNLFYYVPFVRNKPQVRERIEAGEKKAIESIWCAAIGHALGVLRTELTRADAPFFFSP